MADLSALTIPYAGSGITVDNYISTRPNQMNLTLVASLGGTDNITNVTFTFDTNNVSVYPVSITGEREVLLTIDEGLKNITYDVNGNVWDQWNCSNATATTINCFLDDQGANLGSDANTTLIIMVNVTAIDNNNEDTANFSVDNNESVNSTSTILNIDTSFPRLMDLNITDGQTYIMGNTTTMFGTYALSTTSDWTVEATIEDTNLEANNVVLSYRCDDEELSYIQGATGDNQSVLTGTPTSGRLRLFSGTISKTGCFRDASVASHNVSFGLLANDSWNQVITINHTTSASLAVMGQYELLPSIVKVNVTGTLNGQITTLTNGTGLDGTSDYLPAGNLTFNVEVVGDKSPFAWIVWNETGGDDSALYSIKPKAANVFEYTGVNSANSIRLRNISMGNAGGPLVGDNNSAVENNTIIIYSQTLDITAGNNTNDWVFWVYVNNTDGNYTAIGSHRFIVDSEAPSIVMTPPSDRTIAPRASITYRCTPSDPLSGTYQSKWEVQKPDSTWVTVQDWTVLTTTYDDQAISLDNTNLAGTYSVKCSFKDNVGNVGEKTTSSDGETFRVFYSTSDTSGGTTGASSAAKIDLSTQEEMTVKEMQGTITTFTLDGETIHKITIREVGLTTVTLIIESDPIEITLSVGETKEVDVDGDGENDISITLNSIADDGLVDLTTKRLTPLPAAETPTEEVAPTETPTAPVEEAPSKAWLWILIIVIIVVIGVGYWFMKKK
ncbi:MAG: hypothetical protein L6408_02075 [Nanoarchaeota archaeon]|nr:hypothetical protein [Nanoarchaeota archaeon]